MLKKADSASYFAVDAASGLWFEEPVAGSLEYTVDSASHFTQIGCPTAFASGFEIFIGSTDAGTCVPGATFDFPTGTTDFTISGFDPLSDELGPFALRLEFDTAQADFHVNLRQGESQVPEPGSVALVAPALAGFAALRRRRARSRRQFNAKTDPASKSSPSSIPVAGVAPNNRTGLCIVVHPRTKRTKH